MITIGSRRCGQQSLLVSLEHKRRGVRDVANTKVALASALVVLGFAGSGLAQVPADLPEYDVEKHCQTQAKMMGDSNFMLKACFDQEQGAYDEVKKDWAILDAKIKSTCREQARVTMPSYFMLNACVAQEVRAKEAVGNFKFKK